MFDHSEDVRLFPDAEVPERDSLEDLLIQNSGGGAPSSEGPSVWTPSDCYFDPEDPYNPCGPHHRRPDQD